MRWCRGWLRPIGVAACVLTLLPSCGSQPEEEQVTPTGSSVTGPPSGLDDAGVAAWTTWQSLGVDDYRYRLRVSCYCPTFDGVVSIENDHVVTIDGKPYRARDLTGFDGADPTVEGVFAELARAMKHADRVDVEYDPETGVPTTIQVDWMTNAIDDEIGYRLTGVEPLKSS